MKERLGNTQSRRGLLARFFRYSVLGLSGILVGWSFAKRRRLVREGKCVNGGVCRGCRAYEKCGLPAALSAKQVLQGGMHDGS